MTNAPICFIDCETTGLHPDRRPWEIAIVRRDGDAQREITIYVSDVDLSTAELIGLNIGRFYDRHPMYRKEIGGSFDPEYEEDHAVDEQAAQELLGIDECLYPERRAAEVVERWTRGAHIVGAVPNFDTETLAAMLRRHGLCPAWHYHLTDVEALAVGWLNGRLESWRSSATRTATHPLEAKLNAAVPPWKSDELSRACDVEPPSEEERHTAMGDAKWAARLWDRITAANLADRTRNARAQAAIESENNR